MKNFFAEAKLGSCAAAVLLAAAVCLAGAADAHASGAVEGKKAKWVIAVQPTATPEALTDQAKELESFLEARLGREIELVFPTGYAGVVEALRFGHAQAAFMSAWPARLAEQKAGAQVLLAEVREVIVDGELTQAPYYYSYWIVRKDSPAQSLAGLKGAKAAFPSPLSTSGYVAPLDKLVQEKLVTPPAGSSADPKTFFSGVHFAGGYPQAFEALKSGQVDAAVIAGDVPEKLFREAIDGSRTVASQGPIPSHAFVVSKDLPLEDREALAAALIGLGTDEHRALMRKFVSGIFVRFDRADGRHLESLAGMLDRTGLEFTEKK
jgi:phosphonate transport system substrate-binding protein